MREKTSETIEAVVERCKPDGRVFRDPIRLAIIVSPELRGYLTEPSSHITSVASSGQRHRRGSLFHRIVVSGKFEISGHSNSSTSIPSKRAVTSSQNVATISFTVCNLYPQDILTDNRKEIQTEESALVRQQTSRCQQLAARCPLTICVCRVWCLSHIKETGLYD